MKILFYLVFILFLISTNLFSQTLNKPESIIWDDFRQSFLVSSAEGQSILVADTKGNITGTEWAGGLTFPRGLVITNFMVYVADMTYLRGKYIGFQDSIYYINYKIDGSISLNDICADSSGNLYLTDMAANNIFKYNINNGTANELLITGTLSAPNGIIFEKDKNRLVVVTFTENAQILAIDLTTLNVTTLQSTNYYYFDGITKDKSGNYYISSWGNDPSSATGIIFKYNKFESVN